MRELIKTGAAVTATLVLPQARYQCMVLVFSHMRSASTALCNVLCSHADISGYGETHVCHSKCAAPARVAVNLVKHRSFRPRSPLMLDKLLHSHLDFGARPGLFDARAIFLVRKPQPAVASVCELSLKTNMMETATENAAALYYAKRLKSLSQLWAGFPPHRRIGLRTETLLSEPEVAIAKIGQWLKLSTPLMNTYVPRPASAKGGGGDPSYSASARCIEAREVPRNPSPCRQLAPDLAEQCAEQYRRLVAKFEDPLG